MYMMLIHEIHVLELWIEMNVYDPPSFKHYLSMSSEKGLNFITQVEAMLQMIMVTPSMF